MSRKFAPASVALLVLKRMPERVEFAESADRKSIFAETPTSPPFTMTEPGATLFSVGSEPAGSENVKAVPGFTTTVAFGNAPARLADAAEERIRLPEKILLGVLPRRMNFPVANVRLELPTSEFSVTRLL